MYESFYGLSAAPFRLTPDEAFHWESREHARARAHLQVGLSRREGVVVLTGGPGYGKSILVRSVLSALDMRQWAVSHLPGVHVDSAVPLAAVATGFGVRVHQVPPHELAGRLEAALIGHAVEGRCGLLVVEEAQSLPDAALEGLRMLGNLQLGGQALLQLVMVGLPALRQRLAQPAWQALAQRVTGVVELGPLQAQELRPYLEHRLAVAGCAEPPRFDEDVFARLHTLTAGVPRTVHAVADRLLLLGCLAGRRHFSAADLQVVTDELAQEVAVAPAVQPVRF